MIRKSLHIAFQYSEFFYSVVLTFFVIIQPKVKLIPIKFRNQFVI